MGLSNVEWTYSVIKRSILEQLSELRAFDSNWYDNRNITNAVTGTIRIEVSQLDEKMHRTIKMLSNQKDSLPKLRDIINQVMKINIGRYSIF